MKQIRMSATAGAVGAALLVAGCGHTGGGKERAPCPPVNAVESNQVGLSAYETQGVKVKPSSSWYYGDTPGLRAHAVEGGILYVEDRKEGSSEKQSDRNEAMQARGCRAGAPEGAKRPDPVLRVHYRFASDEELYPASRERLGTFLEGEPPAEELRIIGYTDDIGSDDTNVPLSGNRAATLAGHIETTWPEVEIDTVAAGSCPRLREHDPDAEPAAIRKANRRAEVYALPDEEED